MTPFVPGMASFTKKRSPRRKPRSNILSFEPEDAQVLTHIPAYPVTARQLSKYDVKYLNTEKVDEVDCYIFQVSPRTLDRQHPLFDGVIWVDQKYLEVVKTLWQVGDGFG